MTDKKILLTTLVYTENFLPMAQVLSHTVTKRFKSKYPFKTLITQNVSMSKYRFTEEYEVIPNIQFGNHNCLNLTKNRMLDYYKGTLNKFWIWTLTEYDYVVFIDADTFVTKNFDDNLEKLIDKYSNNKIICERRDKKEEGYIDNLVMGSFFVIKPDRDFYFEVIDKYKDKVTDDEHILTEYFVDYCTAQTLQDMSFGREIFLHDGGDNKLLSLFPQIAQSLIKAPDELYQSSVLYWSEYKNLHNDDWLVIKDD